MHGRHRRQPARAKLQARAIPQSRDPLLVLLIGLAAVLAATFALTAHAAPSPQEHELEVKVWTADEYQLPALEREVVRMMQVNPHSAVAHQLLSHIQVRLFAKDPGDLYLLKQASDLAQQAVDLDPRNPLGFVALADILDLMGNADRGIRLLDEAEGAGLEPNWRFYFTRARLMSNDAAPGKVLGLLETALAFPDSEPRIIVPYVVALLQAEASGADLVVKLANWNSRFPSPLFTLTMAITYTELGEFRKAHALYAEILKADPNNRETLVNDAIVLYRDMKEAPKAVAMLEKVITDHGSEMTPSVKSMVSAHLGAAYLANKNFDKAETQFVSAVMVDQGNAGVLDFITKSYRDRKEHIKLVSLIRRLNDQVNGSGVLHALLGETLSEQLAQHEDAVQAFSDAIILDPERSDFYNGMGLAYYRKKSFGDALKLFSTATEVDPNDATARYNEACVLSLMGRSDEALSTLGEALSLDPRLVKTARADGDFASVKNSLKFQDMVQSPAQDTDTVGH